VVHDLQQLEFPAFLQAVQSTNDTAMASCAEGGNCEIVALHPRQFRPLGIALGVLRERCSLVLGFRVASATTRASCAEGGNWPSWPANVPACTLAFAGSQQVLLEFPAHPAPVPDADSIPMLS